MHAFRVRPTVGARTAVCWVAFGFWLLAGGCAPTEPVAPQPNVIFVVLDNVRADRLAQCGYERPTSPLFDRMCARDLAHCTCDAQAPSSWTLPTHASYFTGVEVPQHGAGMGGIDDDNVRLGPGTHARPLDTALPTLAETFADAGYQTLSVSGNPLVSPASGLTRGFETVHHADDFGSLYAAPLLDKTRELLAEKDPAKPLFLFVNIADAHRPWYNTPKNVDWVPNRANLGFPQEPGEPNPLRRDFITGQMAQSDAEALLEHLDDVYDWAVRRADDTFGGLLRALRQGGWIEGDRPFRLVVTSDHGEHLGDHGLMGHAGPYLYEEITRVPLAVFSSESIRELPDQVSALVAYDLLLDGQPRRRPVRSTAFASDTWPQWYGPEIGSQPAAAIWRGDHKFLHQDGRIVSFDLAADPTEENSVAGADNAATTELAALIAAMQSVAAGEEPDAEMLELLKSLGYL